MGWGSHNVYQLNKIEKMEAYIQEMKNRRVMEILVSLLSGTVLGIISTMSVYILII